MYFSVKETEIKRQEIRYDDEITKDVSRMNATAKDNASINNFCSSKHYSLLSALAYGNKQKRVNGL
jgi:hypothetical protein